MTGLLYAVARTCVRRRYVVLAVWLVVAVALVAVSHRMGDNTNNNLSLPGTGSQHATDALAKPFPDQANGSSPIVHPCQEREADRLQVRERGQQCGRSAWRRSRTWPRSSTRSHRRGLRR